MTTALERELDRLYQLPLSDFIAARDELAKRLRAENRLDEAGKIKGLRKPPMSVWLVNRLARKRELDVQRLAKAGETLAKAAMGEGDDLREARDQERQALEGLVRALRELAAEEQVGAGAIERATQTLRAASLSDEGRKLLKRGRLTEELEPPGFEVLAGAAPTRRRPAKPKQKEDRRQQARARVRQLASDERELAKAARSARRDAERAEAELDALRNGAADAEARAEDAARKRVEAEAELKRLERSR